MAFSKRIEKRRVAAATEPARRRATRVRSAAAVGSKGTVPVDLGGLEQFTGYVVRRAQMWIFQDFKRALKDLDMTPAQFSVMKLVNANPGLAQVRVAEALCIERARLVQMLDRLEARGLIVRTRSATDRRSHALHLTRGGVGLLDHAGAMIEAHERNVIARLGARGKSELLRILAPFVG